MAELDGVLVLDTGDAESKIEALGTLFDTITTGFAQSLAEALDQLTTVPEPELETAGLTESVATAVAEGGSEGAAGVSAALDAITVEPLVVPVDADTSEAEAALDDLASSAQGASVGVGSLGGATAGLDAASGLATGSAAGLGSAVEGLSGKVALVAGALTAGAAVVTTFFNAAVEAEGATQRFEGTLGAFAGQVENLRDIEGLNTNLKELALTLGSDDDELRNVASALFEATTAAGRSGPATSKYVQQLIALGAGAAATHPELGSVGQATQGLSTALARGGRFLNKYGLDISALDINTRALTDSNKDTAEELTFVDRAMAGAAIAAERYGSAVAGKITAGADNAIIKQRRFKQEILETFEALGAPLVTPVFDLLDEAQPIVEQIGRIFRDLGQAALPGLTAALQGVEPVLRLVANILEIIAPALPIIVGGLIAYKAATLAAAVATAVFGGTLLALNPELLILVAIFAAAVAVMEAFKGAAKDLTDELENVDSAVSSLAGAVDAELVPAFGRAVKAQKDLLREQGNATEKTIRLGAEIRTFTLIAKEDLGVAIRLAEQYRGNAVVYAAFQAILARVGAAQRQANADSAAAQHLIGGVDAAYRALIDGVAESTNTAVPQMGEVMATFASNVKDAFGDEGVTALSMQDYIDNLNQTAAETQTWIDQIAFLTAAGLEGVAAAIATEGPGGALGKEVATAGAEANVAWNDQLEAVGATLALQGEKQKALSAATAAGIIDPYKKVPGAIGLELADVDVAIMEAMRAASDVSYRAGQDVGGNLADGVAQGIESKQDYINRVLAGTIANAKLWAEGYAGISSPSKLFAKDIGVPISQGIALGIMQASGAVNTAVTATVAGALPSFTMRDTIGAAARVGAQGALGLTGGSMIDHSITVGSITNIGADPDSRARSLVRELRSFQYLGG